MEYSWKKSAEMHPVQSGTGDQGGPRFQRGTLPCIAVAVLGVFLVVILEITSRSTSKSSEWGVVSCSCGCIANRLLLLAGDAFTYGAV